MTAERIDLSALRVGDKVTITFEVVEGTNRHGVVRLSHGGDDSFEFGHPYIYHGTVERAPRPLEVGDRVRHRVHGSGEILGINGEDVWVLWDGAARAGIDIESLTREASHDH